MNKYLSFLFAVIASLTFTAAAYASDAVNQRYIDQLTKGGMISVKQAAQSIYNTGVRDQEVLDVATEVLLKNYPTASKGDIDALSWLVKAIGNSGDARYYSAVKEVADSDAHRKLTKYADQALGGLGSAQGDQYQRGMVDLAALAAGKASAAPVAAAKPAPAKGTATIDDIVVGMSMPEVYDLIGQPTATASHQTGKAWIPFNFGAKDLARTISLYKGIGRVVFSHDGYSSTPRVVEVIVDPNETGYP